MKNINSIFILLCLVLFTNSSVAQILYHGGDSCEVAVPIPVGDIYYTTYDGPGSDHWYIFTAPCDGELLVNHVGDGNCSKKIYSGDCGSLTLLDDADWISDTASHTMSGGDWVYVVINDSFELTAIFDIRFDDCGDDSTVWDVEGTIYYDVNNNGVRDPGELGKPLTLVVSEPEGILGISGMGGKYYRPATYLDDGVYEISPILDDYWQISSDSLFYTINVNDDYEPRDSLDFGIYPDTLIYEVDVDLLALGRRCNDTVRHYVSIRNMGTTVASGVVHLEMDDSLYYVTSSETPDSVVGQNLYWNYEDLYMGQLEFITVDLGTPDGEEDTIVSSLTVTVDSADVEMASYMDVDEQVVTCAYDPNDKTPTPLGQGEFGNIAPDTESIEYLVRFQNTGTDTAINVVIKDQLDENLDWYSITALSFSHEMRMEMDLDGEVSFIFDNIMLPDSNVNEIESHGYIKYKIDLQPDLPLGTSIENTAYIYFDLNPAVETNTTINTLHSEAVSISELILEKQLVVYPNPFKESTMVYFEESTKNYSIKIVDLLGHEVYQNDELNGNHLVIDAGDLKSGMYMLLLIDKQLNQPVSTVKLIVN